MAVLAGQDVGAGGAADGIGAEGILEKHALRGDTVDVGGGCDLIEEPARVGRDGIAGVVIGEHEDDVGLLSRGGKSQCAEGRAEEADKGSIHEGDQKSRLGSIGQVRQVPAFQGRARF